MSDEMLVSPEWLAAAQERGDVVVVDCGWHVPESGRSGAVEYLAGHIPGALYLDLTGISDAASPYVNMLPAPEVFAAKIGRLGIGNDTTVVVYDGSYVSARIWWTFRYFGHDKVRILDGGLRRWIAEGRPLATGEAALPTPATFRATPHPEMMADIANVGAALADDDTAVVDARTATRFSGAESSGYPGVPGGHMPGAVNLPWATQMPAANGYRFVDTATAAELFRAAGVDLARPVIATCGSGVTAAILALTLERMGVKGVSLYDGSWHEWAQQPELPKATG